MTEQKLAYFDPTVGKYGEIVVPPGACPYAWTGDDGTAKQCVERGHCGCDEANKRHQ